MSRRWPRPKRESACIALLVVLLTACGHTAAPVSRSLQPFPLPPLLAGQWAMFYDELTGTTSWIGCSFATQRAFTADPLTLLRRAVAQQFGLEEGELSVAQVSERPDGATHVEFQQVADGNPIAEAGILLQFDAAGQLTYVRDALIPRQIIPAKPELPQNASQLILAAAVKGNVPGMSGSVEIEAISPLMLFAEGDRVQWTIEATLVTRSRDHPSPGLVDVVIAVPEWTVLEIFDRIHPQATPNAHVFLPTPLVRCTADEYGPLSPDSGYEPVELKNLTAGTMVALGKHVQFKDLDAYGNVPWTAPCPAGVCNYRFAWTTQAFAEVNAYYHIDTVQQHVQDLGFTLAKRPIETDVVANVGGAFAYYRNEPVGAGELRMGTARTGWPAALDGKVVVHEYAHAIQAAEVRKRLDKPGEPQGVSEGFADYLALAWFAGDESPGCVECLFAFMNGGDCYRRVSDAMTYTTVNSTDRYDLGLVWMKALWLTLQSVQTTDSKTLQEARDIVDRGVLLGHQNFGKKLKSPFMRAAALATLAAVRADTGKTDAYLDDFCHGFTQQEILTPAQCTQIKTLPLLLLP